MANELRLAIDTTGKSDVVAKIINSTSGQVGIDIPLSEAGTDAVYTGSVGTLVAGTYTVTFYDTGGFLGSAELFWDGLAEINFGNFKVNINVSGESIDAAVGIPTVLADIDGTNSSSENVVRFLYDEQQVPILYLLGAHLASQDKLISDITDALFMIKENATDADGAALYSKFLSGPEVVVDLANSNISILISDYSSLAAGGRYYMVLGIKFSGDSQWREVPTGKTLIEFRQDVIRA